MTDRPAAALVGTRFGSYRITGLIGAGGMGEVYRATDERLGREVAVKVLTDLSDADWRARFEREARLLASINHPHIGTIYGVEEVNGAQALVLELIEGPTLAQRLRDGPLPIAAAVLLARQVADALAAAHEKGIVHRDLKPANVIITSAGNAKVVDFGLAKSIGGPSSNDSATRTASLTREGAVMGTAAYMSPEQARGQQVDEQADIWAFGCVLYEMIAGRRAFEGDTASDVIAAILKGSPEWRAIPASTPVNVVRVIRRCLEKEPARRLHAIADARIELEGDEPATSVLPQPIRSRQPLTQAALALAVIATLIASGWGATMLWGPALEQPQIVRFAVDGGPGQSTMVDGGGVAISPDGHTIVYAGLLQGIRRLFVRGLDHVEARSLGGTEGAMQPFFSPDGQWLGFFSNGKLRKVPLTGGAPEVVADASGARGGAWGPDGTIIFAPRADGPLVRIPASGGTPTTVTTLVEREGSHRYPQFLPGGRSFLYAAGPPGTVTSWSEAKIVAQVLSSGARIVIAPRGTGPRYASGQVLFVQANRLSAVPIDVERLITTGSPVDLDETVSQYVSGLTAYDVSSDGILVSVPGSNIQNATLALVDRTGGIETLSLKVPVQSEPRISPDGSKIAYTAAAPDAEVWIYDIPRRTSRQLTSGGGNVWPAWHPDSRRVAYSSFRKGRLTPYTRSIDGDGPEEELSEWGGAAAWTPDGASLALQFSSAGRNLWLLDRGSTQPRPMPGVGPRDSTVSISPDGQWLGAVSNDLGRAEVVVYPFSKAGDRIQVSPEGGTEPVWSRDGRALYFRNGNDMMMADITRGAPIPFSKPRLVFSSPSFASVVGNRANFDITPDGKKFLMVQLEQQRVPQRLTVTLNWLASLANKLAR